MDIEVRDAREDEFDEIGSLLVKVYSGLEGFPKPDEQPDYFETLANIGEKTAEPDTRLLVAVLRSGEIGGAVVYFGDMNQYGSGGTAPAEKNASGFRLLAVAPNARGNGIAKKLTMECVELAKQQGHKHLVIHTTKAMLVAWAMYERLGFLRAVDLDFMLGAMPVYGFRLTL